MQFLSLITMDDVMLVVNKVDNELMMLGIALALALVATFAVIKLQKPLKKLIRGTAWVAFAIAVVIILNLVISGPMYSLVNMVLKEPTVTNTGDEGEKKDLALSQESLDYTTKAIEQITQEGYVLLKNDGILPLASGTKVNTFGWSSTNALYGGVGSGALSPNYEIVTYLDSLTEAGLVVNTELTDWYSSWRAERPSVGMWAQDWTSPEPTQAEYEAAGMYDKAVAFGDTVLFLIARNGGEGADLPTHMVNPLVEQESMGSVNYVGDSEYPEDLGEDVHYLELTTREKATLEVLNEKFKNIIVIVNAAPAMELGFVEEYENIRACVLAPAGGNTGMRSLGQLLTGKVNFSGRTVDTYLYDLTHAPTYNNHGHFEYTNMSEFVDFEMNSTTPTFVNYVEGIYVGYRFWETAADEGLINYDEEVLYPFGYGLSYTTFEQTLDNVVVNGDQVTATVTVKNTGSMAGKEVVQIYYNPPYTNGGIEKSTANLVAFAKTSELAGGASETLTLTWDVEDMASFDSYNHKAWVLEGGEYIISLNKNSHDVWAEKSLTLSQIVYDGEEGRASDDLTAVPVFGAAENLSEVTYLSRKDGFANYAAATAAPTNFEMSAANKATFLNNVNYDPNNYNNPNDVMPETGVDNGLTMNDMRGVDYDDITWELFLDQLSVEDMVNLISIGGYQSTEIRSIGKTTQTDLDGPASLNNNSTGVASMGFPIVVVIAATWNTECGYSYGNAIGMMANDIDCSGWYAPAMNTHRSAFSGRNFEYYSEDPVLAGKMAAQAVAGAKAHGVYSFIKHYAINDQETNRCNMLCTWFTEQSAREIYLVPFELAVKEGGAEAVMSAFNYIGTRYAGACPELLNTVLRDEWGFRGMVLTDYFGGYGYQDADIQIRNGGDFCLSPMGGATSVLDDQTSATSIIAARQACKNILYTTCNSRAYASDVVLTTPTWQIIIWVVSGVIIALLALVEVKLVLNYKKRIAANA